MSDLERYNKLQNGFKSYAFNLDSQEMKELVILSRKLVDLGIIKLEDTFQ